MSKVRMVVGLALLLVLALGGGYVWGLLLYDFPVLAGVLAVLSACVIGYAGIGIVCEWAGLDLARLDR